MAKHLSRTDLSHIAGRYIEQYYNFFGISKDAPEPIDPERLASSVLGLNVKMLPLCSDGSVLGLTVFQKCGFTVTLGDGTKLVEVFMPKDVVIDSALAADSCTGCRNFTIAHEAAHHILADHRQYLRPPRLRFQALVCTGDAGGAGLWQCVSMMPYAHKTGWTGDVPAKKNGQTNKIHLSIRFGGASGSRTLAPVSRPIAFRVRPLTTT